MKICSQCKKELEVSSFHKRTSAPDGLSYQCKSCKKAQDGGYRETNRERLIAYDRERYTRPERREAQLESHKLRYQVNKTYHDAKTKAYAQANKDLTRRIKSEYKKRNPAKTLALTRKRQAQQLQAVPKWANEFFMEEAYHLARLRTQMTGFEWQVDHIVPLQSKLVCGFHCEANLSVVPARVNLSKGNRSWPDMFT